ncbi:MAG TPA: hypothetical protein PLD43_09085, partial [Anaerolineae bacterium]|nr:hypothetical protein [Anaerolineae bacterium]
WRQAKSHLTFSFLDSARQHMASPRKTGESAKKRIGVFQNHLHGKGTANFRPLSGRCRLQNKPFLVYQNPDFTLHNPVFDKTTDTIAPPTVKSNLTSPLPPVGEGGPGG